MRTDPPSADEGGLEKESSYQLRSTDGAQGVDVQAGLLELTRIEKKVLGSVRRRVSRDGSAALG
jgi:hypothetical protein